MPAKTRQSAYPELIGMREAADRCDVCYRTIRRWIADGHLNAVRVGPRTLKVNVADLEAIMTPVGANA